ncbi:electron transport complex protein RnfG [Anaerotaenia torta]|uniref:FMN-binding protein n=1 Tax=Anaerotaenia torta TaxID=433293 RepID=UPI003D1AFDF7
MKNKKPFIKSDLIRDALALFIITLVSGLALSYVYEVTKEPIAVQAVQKTRKANQEVFPEASSFEEEAELTGLAKSTDFAGVNTDYAGAEIESISKAFNSSGEIAGYNITVSTSAGYKDGIKLVFGYSLEGRIKGIAFLSISETAGLGMKAREPAFIDQFLNKEVLRFVVTKTGAASEDQVDAISGATITSRAVTNAVNAGIWFITEYAPEMGGGQS